MAKKNAPAVAPDPAGVTPGTDAATATETKATKVKKERLFTTSLNLSDIRKREQKIAGKFNRAGRSIKGLGLSAENEAAVLNILKTEFEARAKDAFNAPAEEAGAEVPAESMV